MTWKPPRTAGWQERRLSGQLEMGLRIPSVSNLTRIQEYGYMVYMKATIDIPDELYRQVKAKSALQGQAVREVAVSLFQGWISQPGETAFQKTPIPEWQPVPAWFGGARKYGQRVRQHDMTAVRRSIVRGRTHAVAADATGKRGS